MKCLQCGADIYDGVKKCPYCKTITQAVKEDDKFRNFDFKYTITSAEQMDKIRESVKNTSKSGAKRKNKMGLKARIEKALADRRAAKRAVKRAVRRGEDPEAALKRLEAKEETNPFLKDTAVTDNADETLSAYKRVRKPQKDEKSLALTEGTKRTERKKSYDERKKRYDRKPVMIRKKSSGGFGADKSAAIRRWVGLGVAVLFVALIIYLIVLFFGWLFGDSVTASYPYAKDNALFVVYDGENLAVSKTVIDENYIRKLSEMEEPKTVETVIQEENLIYCSEDGETVFFFENYNPETKSGRLRMMKDGDIEEIITVSEATHNSIAITEDGSRVLFLYAPDENGIGTLCFWEEDMAEPFKIATDIDGGTYSFSQDGDWAVFLQNYIRSEKSGDMYAQNVDDTAEEKQKIDSDVCMIFGSDSDGEHHIYGKEFDPADGSFDVYAVDCDGQSKRLGEKTTRDPIIQKEENNVLIYGVDDDGIDTTFNLYIVEVDSGQKTKIDSEVYSVFKISEDEETIVYNKMFNDSVCDFYAYTEGAMPLTVAKNVIVDPETVGDNSQIAISDSCERVLYISDFDPLKGGGTLHLCVYDSGEIDSESKIADDVHSCFFMEDELFVFTKNYSASKNFFDVYLLDDGEEILLKEEVYPEMFGVDKIGNNIYYISNFNVEGIFGNLERMSIDGEAFVVAEKVFDFIIQDNGDVLVKKNLNNHDNIFDLYLLEEGEEACVEINTSVDCILSY